MAAMFSILGLLAYLFLLIDWTDLRSTLAKGGWASIALYALLAVLIVVALSASPETAAHAPAIHHG